MKQLLMSYTDYNVWANKRIINMFQGMKPDIIELPVSSSFNTIRKTIYHIWDAQLIWLNRMQGISLTIWPSEEYGEDFSGYDLYFIQQSEDFANYVQSKTDSFFLSTCFYKTMKGKEHQSKNWQIILHCMNHSTYHRGQIITMLRNLGETELVQNDFILYLREQENNLVM